MSEGEHEILFNHAALNALKRHQLQSLSKRYGLKSGGKNVDMVQRLQDYAASLPAEVELYLPQPTSTPGPNVMSDAVTETTSPSPSINAAHTAPLSQTSPILTRARPLSSASDAWEVLSESGASLMSPSKRAMEDDSVRSWKSAGNGSSLTDFRATTSKIPSSGSMTSLRSMASSLKRSASRNLLPSRSRRGSTLMLDDHAIYAASEQGPIEEIADPTPPSPASTVGVPKRYSTISLLERPSTVRLVASPAPSDSEADNDRDELPFFGTSKVVQAVKERRSLAPVRPSSTTTSPTGMHALGRRSMPAFGLPTATSFSSIHPPLPPVPPIPASYAKSAFAMPGAMPTSPLKPAFIFGTPHGKGVSNKEFSDAGKALLAEMNAKLPGGLGFGEELLKGKKAELDKLVKANKGLGEGGWGLSSMPGGSKDRFADVHQREFAKMRSISDDAVPVRQREGTIVDAGATPGKRKRCSTPLEIPSAPNGGPMPSSTVDQPSPKKKRMSYLETMRDAGKSLMNLGGDDHPLKKVFSENLEKKSMQKRRSSLAPVRGKSRFGWFARKKAQASVAAAPAAPVVPVPTMPRKTSVYAPRDMPQGRKPFDLQASLLRTQTSDRPLSSSITASRPQDKGITGTGLSRSTTGLGDFGPGDRTQPSSSSSNRIPRSHSVHSSLRNREHAEVIRNARPAPPPPVSSGAQPTSLKHSTTTSRLYAPTASSLARMQATVKPAGTRPLSVVHTKPLSTTQAFGTASTRENGGPFSANFNVNKPIPAPPSTMTTSSMKSPPASAVLRAKGTPGGPPRSPLKAVSRIRPRQTGGVGMSPMKSKGDMRREVEVQAKRAGIKARQERRGEERDLQRMLGSGGA